MGAELAEYWLGGALLFALPGYAWSRALFPEWRLRGRRALDTAVRLGTLSFVWSLAILVVVGSSLSEIPSLGFSAAWSDPRLELLLAGLTLIGFAVAALRGAFSAPGAEAPRPDARETASPLPLLRQLDRIARDENRVRRGLRRSPAGSEGRARLEEELERLRARSEELRQARQEEYGP
ncbi:MAG TPA: DUF1616 domain-containing protein [Thermoplasmata archaeon]|nr:DUF1616 domain-containing protein [Thermoplasmata archaeon]